jgi:hypothetical protein
MIQGKLSFKAATIDNDDATANVNLAKQRILYEDWVKLHKCHHCGAQGLFDPNARSTLLILKAGKSNPFVPQSLPL